MEDTSFIWSEHCHRRGATCEDLQGGSVSVESVEVSLLLMLMDSSDLSVRYVNAGGNSTLIGIVGSVKDTFSFVSDRG